jgi:hypothetical protein
MNGGRSETYCNYEAPVGRSFDALHDDCGTLKTKRYGTCVVQYLRFILNREFNYEESPLDFCFCVRVSDICSDFV